MVSDRLSNFSVITFFFLIKMYQRWLTYTNMDKAFHHTWFNSKLPSNVINLKCSIRTNTERSSDGLLKI